MTVHPRGASAVLAIVARVLVPLELAACGPALPPPERERCYDRADELARARLARECSGTLDGCAEAEEIIAELRARLEACP